MILVLLSLFQETQSSREILNLFKVPSDLGTLAGAVSLLASDSGVTGLDLGSGVLAALEGQ